METQRPSMLLYIVLLIILGICVAGWYAVPGILPGATASSQQPTPTATPIVRECPVAPPTSDTDYPGLARQYACENGLDPDIFERQIHQESGFDPKVTSHAGAQGIAQFMPATAASLGVDPWNPKDALLGAAKLMKSYLDKYSQDYAKALASYNAGSGFVDSCIATHGEDWRNNLYPETQHYILVILGE